MKVKAISKGYKSLAPGRPAQVIEPGMVFEVEKQEKASWFAPLEKPKKDSPSKQEVEVTL